jgi:hypothetical protein
MRSICAYVLVGSGLAAAFLGTNEPTFAQTPKRGGTLIYHVQGEPPNLDCHQSG